MTSGQVDPAVRSHPPGKTFFERYFELLDGPDPHSSLDLVAADLEFSIQWAADGSRKSSQFVGGRDELRGFIDAGDTGVGPLGPSLSRVP